MQALHLPGIPSGQTLQFSFPNKPPQASNLQYTSTDYPIPALPFTTPYNITTYLISVHYTALTHGELTWKEILEPSRFHPHGSSIPGHDVVGTIPSVASTPQSIAPKFKSGDLVWALIEFDRDGAAADTVIAYESELALLPLCPSSSTKEKWQEMLATLPLSGLTAYQALFDHANIRHGQTPHVLITGATGSVGLPTVQLAHAAGCYVLALASSHNSQFLYDLGADEVIPYDKAPSIASYMKEHDMPPADIVVDCVGGATLSSILTEPGALNDGGKAITIVAPISTLGREAEDSASRRSISAEFFIVKPNGEQLSQLGRMVTDGKLVGFVDRVYPLNSGREAMEKVESKRGKGKVVLQVAGSQ